MNRVSDPATAQEMRFLHRFGASVADVSSLRPSNPVVRRALWATIAIAALASVCLIVASESGRLGDVSWQFQPAWFVIALVGFAALQLSQGALWRLLLRSLGEDLDPVISRAIWNTSTVARYVPTSMLTPLIRVSMSAREGVSGRVCLVSIVYEAGMAFTGALVIGCWFIVDLPALAGEPGRYLAFVLPAAALVALQPRIFHRVTDAVLRRFGREPLPIALRPAQIFAFTAAYAATFLLAGLCLFALVKALHPVDNSDILTVVAAHSVGFGVSMLAFVLPGGLGAREAGVAAALAPVMATGIAITIAVAARLVQLVVEVTFAAVTPLLARRARRRGLARRSSTAGARKAAESG